MKTVATTMEEERFIEHILDIYKQDLQKMQIIVEDPDYCQIGCVDKLTKKGDVNPAGGVLAIWSAGLLEKFFSERMGKSVVVHIHLYCGYLFVVQELKTLREQEKKVAIFIKVARRLAREFSVDLEINIERNGSAKPFMENQK